MLEAVPSAPASGSTTLSLDLLDAETRSILRFAERNSEHRHRQRGAGRISSTSVVPEPSASRRKTPPSHLLRGKDYCPSHVAGGSIVHPVDEAARVHLVTDEANVQIRMAMPTTAGRNKIRASLEGSARVLSSMIVRPRTPPGVGKREVRPVTLLCSRNAAHGNGGGVWAG